MTNTSLAQPSRTVPEAIKSRVLRGLKLFHEHGEEIEPLGKGRYEVPGCSGGTYTVDLAVFSGEESCSCPDFRRHRTSCKHLVCASIFRSKVKASARKKRATKHAPEVVQANLARLGA